jgi:hypothetical protein
MTLDLHGHQIASPLSQLKQNGVNIFKVDDLLRPGMDIVRCPFMQDVQREENQTTNEHEQPYICLAPW